MPVTIKVVKSTEEMREFVDLHDEVYAYRSARWPGEGELQYETMRGEGPFVEDRTIRAFIAREGRQVTARVMAVWDERYNRHWDERLGHLALFESRPGAREATVALMDAACAWLAEQGADAARAGFCWPFDDPFVIDEYELLPPTTMRQNPAYYHTLLKSAAFESERGWVDYRVDVTPDLMKSWEGALEAARHRGYETVPVSQVPEEKRYAHFTGTFNDAFFQCLSICSSIQRAGSEDGMSAAAAEEEDPTARNAIVAIDNNNRVTSAG